MWSFRFGLGRPMPQDGDSAMQVETNIFDLIERIEQVSRLDETALSQVFQVPLNRVDDPGNPYIRIFVAVVPEPSPVQKLELRIPVADTASGQALLILTIRSSRAAPAGELRSRFGSPAQVEAPRATAPFGTPTYEIYEFQWGRLLFGYLSAEKDALGEVIFDKH